jgi:hypothetical protein
MGKIKVPRSSTPSPKMIQVLKPSEDMMMTPSSVPTKDFFTAGALGSPLNDDQMMKMKLDQEKKTTQYIFGIGITILVAYLLLATR